MNVLSCFGRTIFILQVYDGENEEAQLVGTFCNNDRPLIIMSSSSFLFVRFYSDGSNQGLGFNAIYTQTDGMLSVQFPLNTEFYVLRKNYFIGEI